MEVTLYYFYSKKNLSFENGKSNKLIKAETVIKLKRKKKNKMFELIKPA